MLDGEGRSIEPGTSWDLEELWFDAGTERDELYGALAKAIQAHHPRRECGPAPTGWCSWEPFGPKVTARDVTENLAAIQKHVPALRYVQIDDGYQPHMGDWLETGPAFGGDVKKVLAEIDRAALEPALWVAPFIADGESKLFREHPAWFVQGADGKPLRSDTVGFGGWRLGPWYALDGTHPDAQKHLEQLFRTLRENWGVTYFKLDALYWGALPGARFHDPSATRVEAFRRGMEAIRRGAGDAFLLGCNHPLWPSLGLLDGSRTSMDVARNYASFASTGRENLLRRWMNGRLWWNDPDCALLGPGPSENELAFHAALLVANGGMILSGDDLRKLPALQREVLQRLASIPSDARRTWDDRLEHVKVTWGNVELHALLNWGETPLALPLHFDKTVHLSDAWTGKDLGPARGRYTPPLAPHSGRVIEVRPAPSPSKPARDTEKRDPPKQ
ncbi:MAG: alpha-galactosidase [Planctomycetes bacterium]|nr:alpha-galactosidase [Planctomycetota bacterium]